MVLDDLPLAAALFSVAGLILIGLRALPPAPQETEEEWAERQW